MKILFICLGNICRSPMAEFVMKELARREGLEKELEIASAATCREEIGNDMYPPAQAELTRHGIPFTPRHARHMEREDYSKYDLILGMDAENLRDMRAIAGGDPEGKIALLMDYTNRPGDVADPWFTRDFGIAYRDIFEGCTGLMAQIKAQKKGTK